MRCRLSSTVPTPQDELTQSGMLLTGRQSTVVSRGAGPAHHVRGFGQG